MYSKTYLSNLEKEKHKLNLKSDNKNNLKKVELSLLNEVKTNNKEAQNIINKLEKEGAEYQAVENQMVKAYSKLMKFRNEAYNLAYRDMTINIKEFDKQARELGIKPTDNKDFNNSVKLREELFDIIKVLDSVKQYKPEL